MDLALYCPEIPQNTGTLIRFTACMGRPIHIIFPCGFILSDKRFQRAVMDYAAMASIHFHEGWEKFTAVMHGRRLILASVTGQLSYTQFAYQPDDCLILGQESSGFPAEIEEKVFHKVVIPMVKGVRSMNVALAGAIIFSEALRQTHLLPITQINKKV